MGQVTISGTNVEIFGTPEGAQSYFNTSINGALYLGASSGDRQRSLVSATRWLLRLGLIDESGTPILPSVNDEGVPIEVQQGTYELAQILIGDNDAASNATTGSDIKEVKAGSTEVSFFRATTGSILPTTALQLLRPYLSTMDGAGTSSSSTTGPFASGTDAESSFDEDNDYGLRRGYP